MSKIEFGGNVHYSQGGYSVTVGNDGAILVAAGDWLSKYSMAIYGDFDHIDRFCRLENGLRKEIENKDLIHVGETLYHKDVLEGECPDEYIPPVCPQPGQPGQPGTSPPMVDEEFVRRMRDIFYYIGKVFWPFTDWQVVGSSGVSVGVDTEAIKIGVVGSLLELTVKQSHQSDADATRLRGICAGGTFGVDLDFSPVSFSIAPPDFWSVGWIAKAPMAGATLSVDELTGDFVALEFSGSCVWGLSLTILLFGPSLNDLMASNFNPTRLFFNTKGVLITLGTKIAGPDLSVSASGGQFIKW